MAINNINMRRISFAILLLLLAPIHMLIKLSVFGAESPKAIKIRNDFLSRVDLKSLEVSGNLCVGIGNVETFDGCDEAYWFLAPVNSHLKVPGFSLLTPLVPKQLPISSPEFDLNPEWELFGIKLNLSLSMN